MKLNSKRQTMKIAIAAGILVAGLSNAEAKVDCPIKIGSVRPESGNGASFGQSLARGLQMGFERINAAGGIAKCQVQLITYDSQSLPANAATLTHRLISQDRVPLVIGSSISTETLAMMEITENAGVPLYVPSAASAKITNQGAKMVWRQSVIDLSAAKLFGQYIAKDLGWKKVGAIYENTDYGRPPVVNVLKPELEANGSQMVGSEAFNLGDVDLSSQLLRLRSAGVDGIVFWGHEKEGAILVRQNLQLGLNLPVAANTGLVYPAFLELLTNDVQSKTNMVGVTQFVWTTDDKAQKEWIAEFEKRFSKTPDVTSMDGFDAAYVIKSAIEAANSTEPAALKAAFAKTSHDGVGGYISFDETGQAVRSLVIVKLTPKSGPGFITHKVIQPGGSRK